MQLQTIQPEDIVEIDRRGFKFLARVKRVDNGTLRLQPVDNRVTYFHASARQVVGIWHANKATRRRKAEEAEAELAIGVSGG